MRETAAASSTFEFSPWFFVVFGVLLVIASTLGPLSRLHERRGARREAESKAQRQAAEGRTDEQDQPPL